MLTVHNNAVSAEFLADIISAFARIETDIGLEEKFYLEDSSGKILQRFKEIIDPPEFVCDNGRVLIMERTHSLQYSPGLGWLRKINKEIIKLVTPLANIKSEISPIFTRVHLPSSLHVDLDGSAVSGYTVIIPLTFHPSIKTVAWSNQFESMQDLTDWSNETRDPCAGINNHLAGLDGIDLRHCGIDLNLPFTHCPNHPDWPGYLVDPQWGAWEPGNVIVFNRNALHCSSNFRNYLPFKDYILIHTHDGVQ